MNIWLSIFARIGYLSLVCLIAFGLAIPVGMAFDAGGSMFANSVAGAYVLTFIPALILGLLPLSVIVHPPILIKVWYWWIALLSGLVVLYQLLTYVSVLYNVAKDIGRGPTTSKVCFAVSHTVTNQAVWLDIASPNIKFSKYGGVPLNQKLSCNNFHYSLSPMKIRAYSATNENQYRQHSEDTDNPSAVLTIDLRKNKKFCVDISPLNNTLPTLWTVQVVPCAR